MCTLGNDDDDPSSFMSKEHTSIGTTCIKCRQIPSIIVLRSKDAYCKECFLKGTVHKFKSLLGKHKLIKPNDKVLIVYDGSESATAMLHFIRIGLDLENQKHFKFQPVVVFIEPDQNFSKLTEARKIKFEELTYAVAKHNFQLHFVSLADYLGNSKCVRVFKNCTDYFERSKIDSGSSTRYENQYSTNLTNRNLIHELIKRECYVEFSKELDCKFCFIPELILDLAGTIISNLSLGRGGLLPMDVGAFDNRDANVTIIRPMRFLDSKEVSFYNSIHNLRAVDLNHLYSKNTSPYDSLQSLIHNFVDNLQEDYPATVSTVVRTADKLGISEANKDNSKCKLCKCPIENNLGILSSNEAIEFSHITSTRSSTCIDNESFNSQCTKKYCFSCRKISKHVK